MNDAMLASRTAQTSPVSNSPSASIAFDSGHACTDLLPDLSSAGEIALTKYRAETLQYSGRAGVMDLREYVASYMNEDGARLAPEDIMIVNGAKQGLDLICRLLVEPGDSIIVTAPTYFTGIALFRNFKINFIEVGQDENGIDTDEMEEKLTSLRRNDRKLPKFVYNVPDFHNPTGITMSRQRREALLAVARRHGLFVVEDSPYKKIRFRGSEDASLKAIDDQNTVFGVGTFSKLVAPGLRVGWVATSRSNISRMMQLKSDGGTCPLTQRMIVEFCRSGALTTHIKKVRETYAVKCRRMADALRREMPAASFVEPDGGYYIWLTLPSHVDGDAFASRANESGVVVLPGSLFFAKPARDNPSSGGERLNTARLAFSHASLREIDEGVAKLAAVLRSFDS